MNCPLCLKRNINSKIICADSDCYVCEDDSCTLCFSENEINKLIDEDKLKSSQSTANFIDLCDTDSDTNECENMSSLPTKDNLSKNILITDDRKYQFNDISENVLTSRSFKYIHMKENEIIVAENSDSLIFNWPKIAFMKIHSKIFYILLLHSDLFNFNSESNALIEAKAEYSLCSTFAKHFNADFVKSISHQFILKLFAAFQYSPEYPSPCKVDDQIMRAFRQYFNKYDPENQHACQFTTSMCCQSCQIDSSKSVTDYFITLPLKKTYFNMTRNRISYIVQCESCSKNARVSIKIRKMSKLMILYCPDGVKGKISTYDRNLYMQNRIGSMAAVVECRSKLPPIECSERNLNLIQYNAMKSFPMPIPKHNYCVSVHDQVGWYRLSDSKPDLCEPVKTLDIGKGRDVRFIIYGELHDKSKYDRPFSIENFVRDFNEENKIDINKTFPANHNRAIIKHNESNSKEKLNELHDKTGKKLTKQHKISGASQFSILDTDDFVSTNQNRKIIQTKKTKSKKTAVNVESARDSSRKDNLSDKQSHNGSRITQTISTNENSSLFQPRTTKPKIKDNCTKTQIKSLLTSDNYICDPIEISESCTDQTTSANQRNVLMQPEISLQRLSELKIFDYLRQNNEIDVDLDREDDLLVPTQQTDCHSPVPSYLLATSNTGSPSFGSDTILSSDDDSDYSDSRSSTHSHVASFHSRSTASNISDYTESDQLGVLSNSHRPEAIDGRAATSLSHLIDKVYRDGPLLSHNSHSYNKFNSTYPRSIGLSSNQSSSLDQTRLHSVFSNTAPSSSSVSTVYQMNPASVDSHNFVTDSSDSASTTTSMSSLQLLTRKPHHTIDDLIALKKLRKSVCK